MRRSVIQVAVAFALVMLPSRSFAQKALILVRHAERPETGSERDPHLTEDGRSRARVLARTLRDAGITAIVTSSTNRTRETAEPTAKMLKIPPKEIDYDDHHVDGVLEKIRACGGDAVVLYVGHSDTLEPLARRFNYEGPFAFGDDPYDNLFVLLLNGPRPTLVHLHYPLNFPKK